MELAVTLPDDLLDEIERRVTTRLRDEIGTGSPWFTVAQAGDYLGITEQAMRGLLKRRQITAYRPNGRVFVSREDLDAWVRGRD